MTHHFPWQTPKPPLSEDEIKKIIDRVGVKISDQSIGDIYYTVCNYSFRVHLDTLKNAPLSEIKTELNLFLDALEAAKKAYDGMNPFITGPVTLEQAAWRKATDRIIDQIKETEMNIKIGRKKQHARTFLINILINIFESETKQEFIIKFDGYRDVDRLEYNNSCMEFLKLIMDRVCPKLSADSLRKDIAWVLKNPYSRKKS